MFFNQKFKELSFLVYGLGLSGKSVVNYFNKNHIKKFKVWDDKEKKLFKNKRPINLTKEFKKVDYIVLSPGVSIGKNKFLKKYKKKIISDLDIFYLTNENFKSIVVTGTNGKSTTCKLITHLLKKNKYSVFLGGNIGAPLLDLKIKKKSFVVIEASSFQLSHSKFVKPDYAILLNISNDHLDWHGNLRQYQNAKLKIFSLQSKSQVALINGKFKKIFKSKKFLSKCIIPSRNGYNSLKYQIKNSFFDSSINEENFNFVYELSKLVKINKKRFISSLNTFKGLPHRYEIFLKKRNTIFINDSKATSFEATKQALLNGKNILWILGGLPKKNDRLTLTGIRKNILKCYIVGKSVNFFEKQIRDKLNYSKTFNLKNTILKISQDIKNFDKKKITILLSPAAASYDQFKNFEKRGEAFKKLAKLHARKFN